MKPSSVIFCCGLAVLLGGCSPKEAPSEGTPSEWLMPSAAVKRVRMEKPQVAVIIQDAKKGVEPIIYVDLDELIISKKEPREELYHEGRGWGDEVVTFLLFERHEDPDVKGNIVLKFELLNRGERYDVPRVSWNQEDDMDLLYGDGWMAKLTRYRIVADD